MSCKAYEFTVKNMNYRDVKVIKFRRHSGNPQILVMYGKIWTNGKLVKKKIDYPVYKRS